MFRAMAFKKHLHSIVFIFCILTAHASAFETGTEREFQFVMDVNVHELKIAAEQAIGYRISGAFKVASIYGDNERGFLLRFKLQSPQLYLEKFKVQPIDYDQKRSSLLDSYNNLVFYAHWRAGFVERAFIENTKDLSSKNFIRSVLSLFQFQQLDTDTIEKDISGICNVKYIAKSSTKFMKIKSECTNDFELNERVEEPLQTDVRLARVNFISTSADGEIETIHSSDHHKFTVNAYPNVGFKVGSIFYLERRAAITECDTIKADDFDEAIKSLKDVKEIGLLAEFDETESVNLVKLVKEAKNDLSTENVGKNVSAIALIKLVKAGRSAEVDDLMRILNARSTKEFRGQLVDVLAGIQTIAAYRAFKSAFNFTSSEDFDYIERYLQSLSTGVRPNESIIKDLMLKVNEGVENEKLKDTCVQTIAALTHKLTVKKEDNEVLPEVQMFLLENLEKCEETECKIIFIRGFQNLRSSATISKLVELALTQPYQISVTAMKALTKMSPTSLVGWKKDFQDIFHQRKKKFDSSARTIAIDILFSFKLDPEDVEDFVLFLKNRDPAYEVRQYLVQKMKMHADKCPQFSQLLKMILIREPEVYNWNVFGSQKGISTVLHREFSRPPTFNGSLLSVQEMKGGVLKQGFTALQMESENEKFNLFTLGLFAGGLSSFVSSDEEEVDPDEDTTPTAGMELQVQSVALRPFTFFKGQGELMGHVWSGTASEPTVAYQGITLLQDHKQFIVLNNGMMLDFSAIGAMSMNLYGKVEMSLWYKNANSEVVQNIGMGLITTLELKSPIVNMKVEISLAEEPHLLLQSKLDFSSKTAICMLLSQPDSQLVQKISRSIDIYSDTSKKTKALRNELNLKYKIPGITHVLNRKNNEMCNVIMQ